MLLVKYDLIINNNADCSQRRHRTIKISGFGTVSMTLPLTVLGDMSSEKLKMVEGVGFEPTYSEEGGVTIRCH